MILIILIILNLMPYNNNDISVEDINTCMSLLLNNEKIADKAFFYCDFCGNEEKVGVVADQLIIGTDLPINYPSDLSISIDEGYILRNDIRCYVTYLPAYFRIDTVSIENSRHLSISFRITNDHFIEKSKRKLLAGCDFEYYIGKATFLKNKGWKITSINLNETFVCGDYCNNSNIDYNFYNKLMQNIPNSLYREIIQKHDSLSSINYQELNIKLDSLIENGCYIDINDFD